tara:strand:+ start:6085 stop:6195 length:111 start_codon:yes stop_codon:yes gene_type:complete
MKQKKEMPQTDLKKARAKAKLLGVSAKKLNHDQDLV